MIYETITLTNAYFTLLLASHEWVYLYLERDDSIKVLLIVREFRFSVRLNNSLTRLMIPQAVSTRKREGRERELVVGRSASVVFVIKCT